MFFVALLLGTGLAVGVLLSCQPAPAGARRPASEADCKTACVRARELRCDAGKQTPAGETCEVVCENVRTSGLISWDLECRTRSRSCAAIDRCEE